MSLRDALLKAGKVDKKQAQKAATEQRKKRKKKKGHVLEAEARERSEAIDAERRAERDARNRAIAEERERDRVRQERRVQLNNLLRAWGRRPSERAARAWYFVRDDGRVGRILVEGRMAAELEYGALGLVQAIGTPDDVRPVAAAGVRKILEIAPEHVRFYVGPDAPADPLVNPPRRTQPPASPQSS